MKEKLVTVARFDDYMKADLARQLLEDEGIKAVVLGDNVGNVYSGVPAAVNIELQTLESVAREAREVLEAHAQAQQERGEDTESEPEEDLADEPEPEEASDEEQE